MAKPASGGPFLAVEDQVVQQEVYLEEQGLARVVRRGSRCPRVHSAKLVVVTQSLIAALHSVDGLRRACSFDNAETNLKPKQLVLVAG